MSERANGPRTGGQILVDQLLVQGADTAFCVPGESYLAVLDALHDVGDRIRLINARHEAGAANMAEAYGKLTGRPGLCFVTRGPGACHAAVGVHTAFQDSTPMILFVGQVGRDVRDREAFQEVDYRAMFGPLAKWVAEIDSVERIPEYLARAYRTAMSGRPGPVVLSLPEDMLTESADGPDAPAVEAVEAAAAPGDLVRIRAILAEAKRPMMIVGGSGWSDEAARDITAFAEANGLPAACSFRRQDVVSSRSECFIGAFGTSVSPSLVRRMAEVDVLLVIGARLGDMTTKAYTTIHAPTPAARVIHVHPSPDEIGRVYQPELGLCTTPRRIAAVLADARWFEPAQWANWRGSLREEFLADRVPEGEAGPLDLGAAFAELRERLPDDAIITLDAGNHTGWPQRYLDFGRPGRQLGSTAGAMGYAVPAAVAAALRHPGQTVIGCVGDGGFQMSGMELATATQYGAKPIIVVFNNGTYGTIRMHQEREYPERVVGTDLINPDFCGLAAAMGCHAERVTTTEEFLPAFERASASGRAVLIELATDPERISTRGTIAKLRNR
ncbi:thiamine pyrophosphate-binding protein [Jiella marina]|uniref:thiamine pyrophosphate-binding protein n=1 Tax=Jiella sp. LLJ827 TaxID=2917712 RepID=UPI002101B13F|nr:thiamine pyrophosphate-binding protein [Jiella sp. LLJ827]MCQ0990122.1 thiamine pyrophosphate-binding protein [Jiella sp. LLJ827]